MKSVDRIDIKKKWPIPTSVKLFLMLAVILGIWGRSCWLKTKDSNIKISNIEVVEATKVTADIEFNVANRATVALKKSFLIKIIDKEDQLVASKIAQIELQPKSKKRYLKILQKFNVPLMNGKDDIKEVTVEVYK
ncbi:MAG: hypothetical protein K9N09_04905 [Candidatus Cloacimonetes bacterium]|nr:hypothetical protein [Candidatus Cloacimonadota bacterium]MCF7813928.1 hypothetical protein [Candidatus Cloacimonadota bacterium]MCF7868022.1 hypothetical protein [Candidatus Cloacimonadota bacterium]MCF7884770.1 hypothetical protein [Candidatus Cloacimonadota bacterium]